MIAVLIAPGFEEIETVVPVDILRRAGIDTRMYGVEGKSTHGGHGIVIECDDEIVNLSDNVEGVVIPGGHEGALNIANSSVCRELIIRFNMMGKLIAAICAAPALVLEPLNVLAGKRFTCYPTYQGDISSGQYQNSPIVLDDNIITAQAAGSAMLFAKEIVAYVKSQEVAQQTIEKIYFSPPTS